MDDSILADQHDSVLTITLNNPTRLNALTTSMYQGLNDALRTAERDAPGRAPWSICSSRQAPM